MVVVASCNAVVLAKRWHNGLVHKAVGRKTFVQYWWSCCVYHLRILPAELLHDICLVRNDLAAMPGRMLTLEKSRAPSLSLKKP